MHVSLQINKVVWSMLVDGKSFAEAEINDMIYDFDRDYKDVGVAWFTTKYKILCCKKLSAQCQVWLWCTVGIACQFFISYVVYHGPIEGLKQLRNFCCWPD
nr:protein SABRE isoform X3 [Ipomoea batatas]